MHRLCCSWNDFAERRLLEGVNIAEKFPNVAKYALSFYLSRFALMVRLQVACKVG